MFFFVFFTTLLDLTRSVHSIFRELSVDLCIILRLFHCFRNNDPSCCVFVLFLAESCHLNMHDHACVPPFLAFVTFARQFLLSIGSLFAPPELILNYSPFQAGHATLLPSFAFFNQKPRPKPHADSYDFYSRKPLEVPRTESVSPLARQK